MKDKILNWINENCFTDKALIAVNVWEIVFYLYYARKIPSYESYLYPDNSGLLGLVHWFYNFSYWAKITFLALIISSLYVVFKKRNYSIWIFKLGTFLGLIFILTRTESYFYYIILFVLMSYYFYNLSLEPFISKYQKKWKTVFRICGVMLIYLVLEFYFPIDSY